MIYKLFLLLIILILGSCTVNDLKYYQKQIISFSADHDPTITIFNSSWVNHNTDIEAVDYNWCHYDDTNYGFKP